MWLILLAAAVGCAQAGRLVDEAMYGTKSGQTHRDSLADFFGNSNRHFDTSFGRNQGNPAQSSVGICFIEVPTASLARDSSYIPAGNGSRSDLSRIQICCNGYTPNTRDNRICDPVCRNGCNNGQCTAPETCTCRDSYVKNAGGYCVSTCPYGCQNGMCIGYECLCSSGYRLDSGGKYCVPTCRTSCGNFGNCTATDTCGCIQGFSKDQQGQCLPLYNPVGPYNPNQPPNYYPYNPNPYNPNGPQPNPWQPNQPGYPPNQPNYNPNLPYQPGYQPNYNPNQPGYQPNYNPNQPYQPGYQPGYNPNQPYQPGYAPNQPGYNPNLTNQTGYQPNYNPNLTNQTGYQPNYNPNQTNQPGYQPNYNPNQPYQPYQPGYNPNQPGQTNSQYTYNSSQTLYPTNQVPNYSSPYNQYSNGSSTSQCSQACLNGACVGNRCSCNPGYVMDEEDSTRSRCIPHCPGGCYNGVCSAPNYCICNVGYRKEQDGKGTSSRCVKKN